MSLWIGGAHLLVGRIVFAIATTLGDGMHHIRCANADDERRSQLHSRLSELGLAIPIIFITTYPEKVDRAHELNAAIISVLQKPFDEDRLVEGINEALKRRGGSAPTV